MSEKEISKRHRNVFPSQQCPAYLCYLVSIRLFMNGGQMDLKNNRISRRDLKKVCESKANVATTLYDFFTFSKMKPND